MKITPLTKKQLIDFFRVYRDAFPDWSVEHDVMLTRTHDPLRQSIDFQSLRSGAYRPSSAINLLMPIPDGCSILNQHLDVRACLEIAILRVIYENGTAPSPCCVLQTRTEPHPWMGQNIPAI
jgi:hypothetical protein